MVEKSRSSKAKSVTKKAASKKEKPKSTKSAKRHQEAEEIPQVEFAEQASEREDLSLGAKEIVKPSPAKIQVPLKLPLEQRFDEDANIDDSPVVHPKPKANFSGNQSDESILSVKLSRSLIRKIKEQAADEGISLEEFVSELLSESVVLRAWEIVERKNQMRGGTSAGSGGGNSRYNNGNVQGNTGGGRNQRSPKGRAMNHMRYQSIMDDKATFLEYVRNQERNRR